MPSASLSDWVRQVGPARQIFRIVTLFLVVALVVPGTAFAVILATYLFLPLPSALPDELRQVSSQISAVYAADGTPIGEFREAEQAIPVEADQIPDTIKRAVVAAEDHDFYAHAGIDFGAVTRAFVHNLTAGRIVEGGSTITQQLVKNLYTGTERSFLRKAQEALLAAQLERKWSKDEILARYLNTIYLGDSTFGIEAASQSYFRKPALQLTLSEAALLAGLIPAPSRYSPRTHPEEAERRRLLVLDQMLARDLAEPAEVDEAKVHPPAIHPPQGIQGRYPYFLDYVRRYLLEVKGYAAEQVFRGGLRVETTLDPRLEDHALRVVHETLPDPADPEAALVSIEPSSGFVRALVGGRNWDVNKVNLALGGKHNTTGSGGGTGRQAGSSFKPFVLARAFEAGLRPTTVYSAPRCASIPGWSPCNYGGSSYGSATLQTAIAKSINTVFAQLIIDVGVDETAALAKRLGITNIGSKPLDPTISLGTHEVSPLDMASAFSVFAARGMRAEPTPILRIVDRDGTVLEDNTERDRDRVLPEVIADNVNAALRGVIAGGTGGRADINRPAAGKTGTEDDYTDAWFVGYTPTLSTAVWMGHLNAQQPMNNVHGVGSVSGGTLPAQMWAGFMRTALEGIPPTDFNEPAPLDSLAELARRRERAGVELGARRWPSTIGGSVYYEEPPRPEAGSPPAEAEPTSTTSSTTTTTTPFPTTTTSPGGGGIFPPGQSSSSTSTTTTTSGGDDEDAP